MSAPSQTPIRVAILGSTGTIGVNTLDVISRSRERYQVFALAARRDVDRLFEQCLTWRPALAVLVDEQAARELATRLRAARVATEVHAGADALAMICAAPEVDFVMAGIVGAAGLLPNLAAARAGKRVMLANKEALVMAGEIFMRAVRDNNAVLLPIDSEHNAVFQCLPRAQHGGLEGNGVRRIWLTASGGPFRKARPEELSRVTPEQACAHPNWVMGKKISVDSATMMNKGLEIIEACWLFDTDQHKVEVVIHPQSVIHSMVEYVDGSILAQLGNPDMRTPIAYALAWPERIESGAERLDFFSIEDLSFERPDTTRFPCLRLAREALREGGTASAILNGANEEAVAAFLDRMIAFTAIPALIEDALGAVPSVPAQDLDSVLDADRRAREHVKQAIARGVGESR